MQKYFALWALPTLKMRSIFLHWAILGSAGATPAIRAGGSGVIGESPETGCSIRLRLLHPMLAISKNMSDKIYLQKTTGLIVLSHECLVWLSALSNASQADYNEKNELVRGIICIEHLYTYWRSIKWAQKSGLVFTH